MTETETEDTEADSSAPAIPRPLLPRSWRGSSRGRSWLIIAPINRRPVLSPLRLPIPRID
jgi:hypothetical protein